MGFEFAAAARGACKQEADFVSVESGRELAGSERAVSGTSPDAALKSNAYRERNAESGWRIRF